MQPAVQCAAMNTQLFRRRAHVALVQSDHASDRSVGQAGETLWVAGHRLLAQIVGQSVYIDDRIVFSERDQGVQEVGQFTQVPGPAMAQQNIARFE